MANEDCPCRNCVPPIRHSGCHAECPAYKAWNEKHQQDLAKIRKADRIEHDLFPSHLKTRRKGRMR